VKRFLNELGSGEGEFERLKREERGLRAGIRGFSASDNLTGGRCTNAAREMPHFLDTNILIYSISAGVRPRGKRRDNYQPIPR
jgi:hypothetical protein